jgi:phenylalanyl-tRNA synthetase alpha chain
MPSAEAHGLRERAKQLFEHAIEEIKAAQDVATLATIRAKWLGKNGEYKALLKAIPRLDPADRSDTGAWVNLQAVLLEQDVLMRRNDLDAAAADGPPDVTFDPTLVLDEIRAIFTRLGFDEVGGPEIEDAWHNFDALNIPAEHPARLPSDNFYVEGGRLLRSQTSTMQIRAMESRKPPLRVFAPGRVYRPDAVDARHLYAFFQVEGLMVGEDVTFADLKACLNTFASSMYGDDVVTRFRPSYFPFTEVSAELDIQCPGCHGREGGPRCPVCGGEGWMEILGCGMVHPNVFRHVGYDPEKFTGFAFGMGVERVAMRRWKLDDVRYLVENDVRFLSQFR